MYSSGVKEQHSSGVDSKYGSKSTYILLLLYVKQTWSSIHIAQPASQVGPFVVCAVPSLLYVRYRYG